MAVEPNSSNGYEATTIKIMLREWIASGQLKLPEPTEPIEAGSAKNLY